MDQSDAAVRAETAWKRWMERLRRRSLTLTAASELINPASPDAGRVLELSREGKLLAFEYAGETWLPMYQFSGTQVLPAIPIILSVTRGVGVPDDVAALWIISPSGLFAQQDTPADHLGDAERVVTAARLHFEAEW